ncbi:hypothetical protein C0Q70_13412 [Pomacea canaliculata]|uniref:Protein ARV n=1 Tax=Pomacea canaliculata TaxID=400727 RepID=A0A2T7NX69_POMCA|nr:protein ARV1-like [Pomacea canaliculata]XP_025103920.1 protein ARV1-like [Pomacea canaliculata]XP_025103921.1 protein ARV1-like [Pomacea canaliculata]PVD25752.1 hypothetical protein C0Q70_13412 [Pomacea canaliculata]
MMARKQAMNVCHCGQPVKELYRDFKKGIIKIAHCSYCKQVADKYIEYDEVIIFLDILLLQQTAYRHVLVNSKIKGYWRFLLVLWLCDALTKLVQRKADVSSPGLQPDHVFYYALELAFYKDYLLSAAESFIFVVITLALLAARYWMVFGNIKTFKPKDVIQAVIVSSMGRLLVIPALIWGQTYSTIGVILTRLFVFFSNVQALHVICKDIGVQETVLTVAFSYLGQYLFLRICT